jgi:anthranilate phosphoribosyltransferase
VAKHGNRSVSSRCGSADVVEALGIAMDRSPEAHARLLREVGITFLFAPAHHPALKHAAVARRELGVRTIFNALGPLVNPARATHQIVGVYDESLRVMMAEALGALGVKRAWVVRSVDGLDEVSPSATTRVSELREDGSIVDREVSPNDFGLPISHGSVAVGGSPEENAKSLEYILMGGVHAATDAVILNASAALCAVGSEADPRTAAERARAAIERGDAGRMLTRWREAAR